MASPLRLEDYEVAELYQAQDPEVVIVEMRAKATVTTTGRSLTATSIQTPRIREGHIVLWRDFADPRILEDVTGEPRAVFPSLGQPGQVTGKPTLCGNAGRG
jgi:ketosteroid isomerase-like protein